MPQMDITTFFDVILGVFVGAILDEFQQDDLNDFEEVYLLAYDRYIRLDD
jgi:hypothetical protein